MRKPRASIGWMLALIGVIAVNIALVRALVDSEPWFHRLAALYPMVPVLQSSSSSWAAGEGRCRPSGPVSSSSA